MWEMFYNLVVRTDQSVYNLSVTTSKGTRDASKRGSYPSTAGRRTKTCEIFRIPGTARWGACKEDGGRREGTGD